MASDRERSYWKGIEEREHTPEFEKSLESEFPAPPVDVGRLFKETAASESGISRRSFLKAAGFTVAGSVLAACSRAPVEKAIPLLVRPEEIKPGRSLWYATTCSGCNARCGILAKVRDGRPIKIEGNPQHPLSKGGVCPVGQATVLSLYDSKRLQKPLLDGKPAEWDQVDASIKAELARIKAGVYLLTGTVTSPSTRQVIRKFLGRYENAGHIEYDPVSYSAILDAHEHTHGKRLLPHYRFDRADVIVSFAADFLGTWISPVEFTKAYTSRRTLAGDPPTLSRHIQFEGRMSLTGSNADQRIKVTPGEGALVLLRIAERLAAKAGVATPPWRDPSATTRVPDSIVDDIADTLWQARGKSLVVCGLNDVGLQRAVNFVNHVLGNYGKTLDIAVPALHWKGNDRAVRDLVEKMQAGKVQALLIAGVNPAYSLPHAQEFAAALQKVPVTVAFTEHLDETSESAKYVCPIPHSLESWDDAEVLSGVVSVAQPAISRLGQTRSLSEALVAWMGEPRSDLEIVQSHWRRHVFPRQKKQTSFQKFWDKAVQDGYARVRPRAEAVSAFKIGSKKPLKLSPAPPPGSFALVLYQKVGMLDGSHAHNPWLHELPDPVTKAVWDNYVCLAPATATALNIEEGDILRVAAGDVAIELPAQIQPGQHERVVAIAVGYGRKGTDRFAKIGPQWLLSKPTVEEGGTVGKNGYPLAVQTSRSIRFENTVSIEPTGRRTHLAFTQTHQTITVPKHLGGRRRNMVRETTLAAYIEDPASGNHYEHKVEQLWPQDHKYTGRHWAMAIDLNRCTGCSACVISCQAENNVAVVGKDEVYRRREMHWIRIDRYYSGDDRDVDVIHQPVMCHHCDYAPCESVCPVLATVHSDEGLNLQIYNRCIGIRYCANNCPYKVRRFNWFQYWRKEDEEHLVLNPDVTTRSRGIMEKCSWCVQRIQEAETEAKRLNRPLKDGDIKLACEQSCPADAIVFGDTNDPESRISKLMENPRHYRMLEELNIRPTVGYLTKVRHRQQQKA